MPVRVRLSKRKNAPATVRLPLSSPCYSLLPIPMPIRIPIRAYPNLKFSIPLCIPLGPGPPFQLCPLAASMLLSPFSEGNCDWEQGTGTGTGARLVCRRQTPPAPQAAPIYPSHIYITPCLSSFQRQPQQHTTHTWQHECVFKMKYSTFTQKCIMPIV